MPESGPRKVYVWDRFVRFFHWSLAASFAVAYLTEDELMGVHAWAGYAVGVLIALRLAWGLVGPRHARFADFVRGPRASATYVRELVLFRAPRHLGHSPGAGAMVVVLFLALAITLASGLVLYAVDRNAGPLAGLIAASAAVAVADRPAPAAAVGGREHAREGDRGRKERRARGPLARALKEVHEFFANLAFAIVIVHLGAVGLASLVHRENLVAGMITGFKRAPDAAEG